MLLSTLADLPPAEYQAVIINAGTPMLATLALMSALKYADMPVLIIDCDTGDSSKQHFIGLMVTMAFDLLSAPIARHGKTLDWLLANIPAQNVLLIDSDLELLDAELVTLLRTEIEEENVFGSGSTHGPHWVSAAFGNMPHGFGYYQERPYIPITLLKIRLVREALDAGFSFDYRMVYNDFAPVRVIGWALHQRFRIPALRHWPLHGLRPFKRHYNGHQPSFVWYDTGADVYQYLKHKKGYVYAGFPLRLSERHTNHFNGATRRRLLPNGAHDLEVEKVSALARQRLRDLYDITMAES